MAPPPHPEVGTAGASNPRWALTLACAAIVLMTLDITVVNVALADISVDLHAELGGLQWVVNAYTLSFAALLLTGGALVDRFGPAKVFAAGTLIFTLASIACAASPSVLSLEGFRALQGGGAALTFPAALALIASHYEGQARQTAIGIFNAIAGAAASLGPLVGGAIIEGASWRWIFVINVPVGIAALIAAAIKLRDTPDVRLSRSSRLDLVGATLAVAVLFSLNYAVISGPDAGWNAPNVIGAFAAAAVLFAAFLTVQLGHANPMLDVQLFRIPAFTGAVVLSLVVRIASFGAFLFITLWLEGVLRYSAFNAGLRLLAMTCVILVVAPFTGSLQARFSPFGVVAAGFAAAALAFLTMARVDAGSDWQVLLPGFLLLGLGIALAYPPLMGVAVRVVPPARVGIASGTVNTFFPLGTAVGVAVFGALFTSHVNASLSNATLVGAGVPEHVAGAVRESVNAGRFDQLAATVPGRHLPALQQLADGAFSSALALVMVAAAFVCLIGVIISLTLVRADPRAIASNARATDAVTVGRHGFAEPASELAGSPGRAPTMRNTTVETRRNGS